MTTSQQAKASGMLIVTGDLRGRMARLLSAIDMHSPITREEADALSTLAGAVLRQNTARMPVGRWTPAYGWAGWSR